jgi:hypothetical protein
MLLEGLMRRVGESLVDAKEIIKVPVKKDRVDFIGNVSTTVRRPTYFMITGGGNYIVLR